MSLQFSSHCAMRKHNDIAIEHITVTIIQYKVDVQLKFLFPDLSVLCKIYIETKDIDIV